MDIKEKIVAARRVLEDLEKALENPMFPDKDTIVEIVGTKFELEEEHSTGRRLGFLFGHREIEVIVKVKVDIYADSQPIEVQWVCYDHRVAQLCYDDIETFAKRFANDNVLMLDIGKKLKEIGERDDTGVRVVNHWNFTWF